MGKPTTFFVALWVLTIAAPAHAIKQGTPATAFPEAILLTANGFVPCSGVLLSPTAVLTAGHCSLGSTVAPSFDVVAPNAPDSSGKPQTAHASMNHLAISVPLDKFDEYAERLRARGVSLRVINHEDSEQHSSPVVTDKTWIRSMYFTDPNGIHMELSALTRPYDGRDVSHDPVNAAGERVPAGKTVAARS